MKKFDTFLNWYSPKKEITPIKQNKRVITDLIVHTTGTPLGLDIGAKEVRKWHLDRGWNDIGYHYLIRIDGTIEKGRHDSKIGAHVKGHNSNSIGICYVGGLDENRKPKDTRTYAQKISLNSLLVDLHKLYPESVIKGHRDYSKDLNGDGVISSNEFIKACPCFDAKKEYEYIF